MREHCEHCWWKIDVQIGASSRQQDGSDAGPEYFELRVFLQGLRQKQHRWGAPRGIQNRFNQRFCIETVLTQKSSRDYCLEDVAILTEGKSSCRLQVHANLTFSSWRWHIWSPLICSRCIPHRIYAARTTFTKSRRQTSKF